MTLPRLTRTGVIQEQHTVFTGRIFSVTQATIHTPDGLTVARDVVHHIPAVVVLALTPDLHQVLVNTEYRAGINSESYSLPAGLIDAGESPIQAASREVREETGFTLWDPQTMTTVTTSEGYSDEENTLLWGTIDPNHRGTQAFDADEYVTSRLVPFTELVHAIQTGVVTAGQAVAAVTYFMTFIAPGRSE